MSEATSVSSWRDGDDITVAGGGALDLTNCDEFVDTLAAASREAGSVTVDLRELLFMDTAVVQELARCAVALLDKGKRLKVLVSRTAYPYRVLQISGFSEIMEINAE